MIFNFDFQFVFQNGRVFLRFMFRFVFKMSRAIEIKLLLDHKLTFVDSQTDINNQTNCLTLLFTSRAWGNKWKNINKYLWHDEKLLFEIVVWESLGLISVDSDLCALLGIVPKLVEDEMNINCVSIVSSAHVEVEFGINVVVEWQAQHKDIRVKTAINDDMLTGISSIGTLMQLAILCLLSPGWRTLLGLLLPPLLFCWHSDGLSYSVNNSIWIYSNW